MQPQKDEDLDSGPWYRQPWFWLLMVPLFAAMCSSVVIVYNAVVGGDDIVQDNYYKNGRLINIRLEQDVRATELGLHGTLDFDLLSGEVFLDINSDAALPSQLLLLLSHPASKALDQQLLLQQVSNNRFRADLNSVPVNRWYLRVLPTIDSQAQNDAEWRLLAEIDFRIDHVVELKPRN